jgi:chorismate synthase
VRFLTAGESHGPCLTAIVEGLPAGLALDIDAINHQLARRQAGYGRGARMSIERDEIEILGGVIAGRTIGAPLALRITNRNWDQWRDRWQNADWPRLTVPRPGHADHAGMVKYGFEDGRLVLERASARETAVRVAVGAVARQLLAVFGSAVGSYVTEIGGVEACVPDLPAPELAALAERSEVRCPDGEATRRMMAAIDAARAAGSSLGGVFVVIATGLPVGLGSYVQWDRRIDARLAAAVMSIPAVKGVEIGPAFAVARLTGTEAHDDLFAEGRGGVTRRTNHAGGVEGGMTNGAPLLLLAAMKPIPTTATRHESVDLATGQPAQSPYERADVCAVPAGAVIGEAMVAWTLAEALIERLGGDSLRQMMR